MQSTVFTIGHSTLELGRFVHRLKNHRIQHLADVRSMPGSRKFPWFNSQALAVSLPASGIGYSHHPNLGGRRSPGTVTPDLAADVAGWSHKSFRSYAAWTLTAEFQSGVDGLMRLVATGERVAFMCSEAVPWRCHRSILATVLEARGVVVGHIMDDRQVHRHVIGEWGPEAVVSGGRVSWPAPPDVNALFDTNSGLMVVH